MERPELIQAAKEFALLVNAQRKAFKGQTKPKPKRDYPEKALNIAVMAAWAYTAGLLRETAFGFSDTLP